MIALRRTLAVLVLVSVILTALTPAPLLGRPAAQTPAPPPAPQLAPAADFAAPATPEAPQTPRQYLARLAPEADREALAAFLAELHAQAQIGAFQWLAESQAFLITGQKGLPLVIARPAVQEILEATPETLALPPLAAAPPAEEAATPEQSAATETPDAAPETGDAFLVRLVAPQTRETLGDAYARLTFELDYLHQQGQIGAYRWLPEANAVRVEVIAPQAVDFLRRSADVADIGFWDEAALEQARIAQHTTLRDLARAAISPRAPAHILAYTPTTPTVSAQLYNNYLDLSGDSDATTVFTLTTAAGEVKNDPSNSYVYWYYDMFGYRGYAYLRDADYNSVAMLPGDVLYVAQSGHEPFAMALPHLTAYADSIANTVAGNAPPDITSTDPITPPALRVMMLNEQYVTTTAAGAYLADNVGDFAPGDSGAIRYYDARGNQTYLQFRAPAVGVRGWGYWNGNTNVRGYTPMGSVAISVTLTRGGVDMASAHTTTNSDGYFSVYLSEAIEGGDVVAVTTAGWSATVTAPDFTTASDPDTDTITGNTNADVVTTTYNLPRTLTVWPQTTSDEEYQALRRLQPDGSGDFIAANPFEVTDWMGGWMTTTVDIQAGDAGHLRYIHADGNRTYFRFKAPPAPPVLYARGYGSNEGYSHNTYLGGYVPGFCSYDGDGYGSAALRDAAGTLKAQATAIEACPNIYVNFGVAIEAGDVISATFGGKTTTMTVPDFTAASDPDMDTITGHTDADVVTTTYGLTRTLTLWPQTPSDDNSQPLRRLQPTATGDFTAANPFEVTDWMGGWLTTTVDIQPGDAGHLRYIHADGNRTYFRFKAPPPPPVLYARGHSDGYSSDTTLGGYIPGFCSSEDGYGSAALRDAAGTLKSLVTDIYACSNFNVTFSAPIEAGDVISASFSGKTTTMTVPDFTATSDPDTDTITGHTDAEVVTTTYDLTRTLTVWPQTTSDDRYSAYQRVQPTAGGDFTAANPFEQYDWWGNQITTTVDIQPGNAGHLRYIHADGNRTYFRFKAPTPPPVLYARGHSSGYNSNTALGGNIAGFCSSEDGYGTATLRDAAGVLKAQATNIYACSSFNVNFNVAIEAGDVISATFGGKTTTMTVPDFTATMDPNTDTITGNTNADVVTTTYGLTRTLTLWPQTTSDSTSQPLRRLQPAANGAFTAANPFERYDGFEGVWYTTTVDIRDGDAGHLRYIHADGNRTYFRFKAPAPPELYARGHSSGYSGNTTLGGNVRNFCSSEDGYGSAVLRDAAGTLKSLVTDIYACSNFNVTFSAPIEAGDVISATFGGKTTTMTVPDFIVTSDPNTDAITGNTDADVVTTTYGLTRTLTLWPQTTSDSTSQALRRLQPAATGDFTAANPFERYDWMGGWYTTTVDVQPGNVGHLRYLHADKNRTYVGFVAPGLYVRGYDSGYVADNYVYVKAGAGLPVTVTLKRGAATLATVSGWLNTNNVAGVYLTDEYDNPIFIQAGDTVEAALPGQTLTAQVPTLTAAPDTATGLLTGVAPANITRTVAYAAHTLYAYRSRNSVGHQVTTDAAGAYSADFSPNGGFRAGDMGWLRYVNANGYHIYENYWIPVVYARGYENGYSSENYVSGLTEANTLVTTTLKRGGAMVARAYDWTDPNTGQFSLYLYDVYGYAANILNGDTLEIQTDSETTSVPIPQFTATSNHETDTVNGATNAVVTSETPYMTQTLAIWPDSTSQWGYGKHVRPVGGAFTAANPFYYRADPDEWETTINWSYGAAGHARYINADGNQVYTRFQAPLKPVVYVRGYYSNDSYNAENSIGGYVNGFCGYGTATLKDGAGVIKAQTTSAWACSSLYAYFYDAAGNAAPILPGDRMEVTFGGVTTVVDVPTFTVTSDPVNDRLRGTTNAVVGAGEVTQTLAIWPQSLSDYDYGKLVTVQGGAFTAENPFYYYANPGYSSATLDWAVGANGHLRYVDAAGNRVYGRIKAHYPQPVLVLRGSFWLQRYVADNFVSGYAPGFCGNIEITVRNSSGTRLYLRHLQACSDFEVYLYGPHGAALDLEAGDTVDVVFLETNLLPVSATVPEFDVESDHVNSTISGSTNATVVTTTYGLPQTLAVWPTSLNDSYYGKYVQPAGGVFSATNPFYYGANPTQSSATLSWSAGTVGHLRYITAQWHHIYARFATEQTGLRLYLRGDHPNYSDKGYYAENLVSGQALDFCDYGSVTLKDSVGTVKAQSTSVWACSSFYTYLYDSTGQAVNIQAGDQVEAVFGDLTKTLIVPEFTAQGDADLDRVTGSTTAPVSDTTPLAVYPTSVYENSSTPYQEVQPVAGVFTATNPFYSSGSGYTNVDIKLGDRGHLRYTTAAGDRIHYRFMAPYPAPRVWVQKDGYRVYGYLLQSNVPVTVTLRRADAAIASAGTRTDGIGYFYSYFYDAGNLPVLIREGDTVRVEAGATTIDVPVVALTAQVDVAQDAVWGVGPANAELVVNNSYPVTTAADGAYRADLRGRTDLRPGSWYEVAYRNAEDHTVFVAQYVTRLNAQLHSNYAWGYGPAVGRPVTATLKTGATVKGVVTTTASTGGYFTAYLYDTTGKPVLIAAGDTLEMDFGDGQVIALPIVGLTTQINTATGAVTGSGPANTLLGVDVDAYSADRSVMTDNAGQWATQVPDFYTWSDAHVRVRHANAQGHEVWLYTVVRPVVFVRGTGAGFSYSSDQTVSGYADGRAWVAISLRRGGNVIAQQSVIAASYGWFNATLTQTIQAGDEVSVQWTPRAPNSLSVPPLTANININTAAIFGTGPADATIGVQAHGYARSASTASDGAYTVAMPLVTGNEAITLRYQTPAGHWIHARVISAPPPHLVAAFTQSATSIVAGDTVAFTDTSTTDGTPIVSWYWTFGDGGTSVAQHPNHQYNNAGVFTVWLTVGDALGYTDNTSATVHVASGCVPLNGVAFTYLPAAPQVNQPITFTATYTPTVATSPITYTWDFGDGETGTGTNPIHTYGNGGSRTVQVTAYNLCTPDGVTHQHTLVIGAHKVYLPLTLRNQ